MKLNIHNFYLQENDQVFIDADLALSQNTIKWDTADNTCLNARDLDIALSRILETFSSSVNYKYDKYKLRSNNQICEIIIKDTLLKTGMLELTFSIDNGCVYKEKIWTDTLLALQSSLYKCIISNLINNKKFYLCEKWASNSQELPEKSRFKIGDSVKTIVNNNSVKTERIGHIFSRSYHFKQQRHIYSLLIEGKVYKKRYSESDLSTH